MLIELMYIEQFFLSAEVLCTWKVIERKEESIIFVGILLLKIKFLWANTPFSEISLRSAARSLYSYIDAKEQVAVFKLDNFPWIF